MIIFGRVHFETAFYSQPLRQNALTAQRQVGSVDKFPSSQKPAAKNGSEKVCGGEGGGRKLHSMITKNTI